MIVYGGHKVKLYSKYLFILLFSGLFCSGLHALSTDDFVGIWEIEYLSVDLKPADSAYIEMARAANKNTEGGSFSFFYLGREINSATWTFSERKNELSLRWGNFSPRIKVEAGDGMIKLFDEGLHTINLKKIDSLPTATGALRTLTMNELIAAWKSNRQVLIITDDTRNLGGPLLHEAVLFPDINNLSEVVEDELQFFSNGDKSSLTFNGSIMAAPDYRIIAFTGDSFTAYVAKSSRALYPPATQQFIRAERNDLPAAVRAYLHNSDMELLGDNLWGVLNMQIMLLGLASFVILILSQLISRMGSGFDEESFLGLTFYSSAVIFIAALVYAVLGSLISGKGIFVIGSAPDEFIIPVAVIAVVLPLLIGFIRYKLTKKK